MYSRYIIIELIDIMLNVHLIYYISSNFISTLLEMIMQVDDSVGRIVHTLGETGMLRDSLILFLTDNGAATIGKNRNHGSNYPLRGVSINSFSHQCRCIRSNAVMK